jgi:hypothetical protein
MVSLNDQVEFRVFLVWKLMDHGPVLVAIDTSQSRADQHVLLVRDEARCLEKPIPETFVEESKLNHLYGQTVSDISSFKYASALSKLRNKTKDY